MSLVIPAKNEEGYIGRTLQSLSDARRDHALPLEVVVVDGGSSDATPRLCDLADRMVADSALACRSIAHARNVGCAGGTSDLIFHMDADVLIPDLPRFLTAVSHAFRDEDVVAVTTRIVPYPWDRTRTDRVMHWIGNAVIRWALRLHIPIARGECQIVRRDVFESLGGYNGNIIAGEDCDLFRRMLKVGKIRYLSDYCVHHSPRRFRALGYLRVLGIYTRETLALILLRRNWVTEWQVIR